MGKLSTHVLDTMHGRPAVGLTVTLYRLDPAGPRQLNRVVTDADGRAPADFFDDASFVPGPHRIVFSVGAYFLAAGVPLKQPPFLDDVPVDFQLPDDGAHYHVPLLASPWAYSTYRGS